MCFFIIFFDLDIPLVIGSKSNAYSFSDFLHSPFYIVVNIYYKVRIYTHAKKAQTSHCLSAIRGLRIAYRVNKQQETYADMTTPC